MLARRWASLPFPIPPDRHLIFPPPPLSVLRSNWKLLPEQQTTKSPNRTPSPPRTVLCESFASPDSGGTNSLEACLKLNPPHPSLPLRLRLPRPLRLCLDSPYPKYNGSGVAANSKSSPLSSNRSSPRSIPRPIRPVPLPCPSRLSPLARNLRPSPPTSLPSLPNLNPYRNRNHSKMQQPSSPLQIGRPPQNDSNSSPSPSQPPRQN